MRGLSRWIAERIRSCGVETGASAATASEAGALARAERALPGESESETRQRGGGSVGQEAPSFPPPRFRSLALSTATAAAIGQLPPPWVGVTKGSAWDVRPPDPPFAAPSSLRKTPQSPPPAHRSQCGVCLSICEPV